MGSPWWQFYPRGPSGWRRVTSRGLVAAPTCSEPPVASQCPRAGWCCGRSLWSGIYMGEKTLAASPCPYMPSRQTGKTRRHMKVDLLLYNLLYKVQTFVLSVLLSSRGRSAPAGIRGSPSRSVASSRPQNSWRWAGGSGRQHALLMEIQLTKVQCEHWCLKKLQLHIVLTCSTL